MTRVAFIIAALAFILGCKRPPPAPPGEGYLTVNGGRIWYRVIGNSGQPPVLLLHGGPGFPSFYLNPLEALGVDRPVIFFDQLGCGRSDELSDTALMTLDNHIEQVHALVQALKLESFYLYGHSWGTILVLEYYLAYPTGIRALIFGSPVFSVRQWTRDADTLLTLLPIGVRETIGAHECAGTTDSPEYQKATEVYFRSFVARNDPHSPDIDSAITTMNHQMYRYMWGPSEFTCTGTLRRYEAVNRLREIEVPVLFLAGEFDEARPPTVEYYASQAPYARFFVIPGAAHLTMQDNPDADLEIISNFLRENDQP